MVEFTADERALMRRLALDIGHAIAVPGPAIAGFAHGTRAGGGGGLTYRFGKTSLSGQWHEWIPVAWAAAADWRPTGQPTRWRVGDLLRHASISYDRLRHWCEALPADIRAQALTHWQTYPVDTRDLDALQRLALAVIDAADPQPALFDLDPEMHAHA